ncbi:hypothetical protein BJ912DRAFT_984765 [Pholiota molesta]|nr:hypothetical protein BJ912DRAFT_984765 [Pholiota molesta]
MVDIESKNTSSKMAVPTDENWQDSLNNLERELAAYRKATSSGATEDELASAAARVTNAVQLAQAGRPSDLTKDLPPVYQSAPSNTSSEATPAVKPKTSNKLKRNANPDPPQSNLESTQNISSDTSSVKSDNPAKQIGRGLLIVVATPVAVAGMGLYAVGMMVEGTAMVLKGMGSVGKKPFQKMIRGASKGKKRS